MRNHRFTLPASVALVLGAALAQPAAADWVGSDNTLDANSTISNPSLNSSSVGYTGNAALTFDAWGHQGAFANFFLPSRLSTVTVDARSSVGNYPGFTLYRTNVAWAGETVGPDATVLPEYGAIHDFNQVGQAGDDGIVWATGADGIVQTLGYVSGAPENYVNAFGGHVDSGAHDLSIDDVYEQGVSGTVGITGNPLFATSRRFASLTLTNLASGWYTVFLGGSYAGGVSAGITLSVTGGALAPEPVPLPPAAWLLGAAGLVLSRRTRRARP